MEESLFAKVDIELLDLGLQELENDYKTIKELVSGKGDESEIIAGLQGFSLKGAHDQVVRGLFYGFLLGHPWFNFLLLTSRDGFMVLCKSLVVSLPKLKNPMKAVELLFALIKIDSPGYPETFLYYLRTLPLNKQVSAHIESIVLQPVVCMVFYKYLRQAAIEPENVRQETLKVINFIWKRQKNHLLSIGRDLFRLVRNIAESPDIDEIWNDLLSDVSEGCPLYWALLSTPTNPKFHSMLIPPLLESKLIFIVENSPLQSFPKYLKWILEAFPSYLLQDIARFLVNFMPSQESSPRWQLVAWILSAVTDQTVLASVKHAVTFDCLFFTPNDQIYSIEPCLSLIKYSLIKFPLMAKDLTEFLLNSYENYDKRLTPSIKKSLKEVMNLGYLNGFFPPLELLCRNEKILQIHRDKLTEISETDSSNLNLLILQETEDTYISTKRTIMENMGEVAFRHASEPTFDSLVSILQRFSVLGDDLYHFLMKCMLHEYTLPLTLECPSNLLLTKIFQESENNIKVGELLKYMINIESSIGVRFLLYSLHNNPSLYLKYSDKLERDVKISLEDLSMQSLSWIFRKLFTTLPNHVNVGLLHFFLQTATFEQIHQIELDVNHGSFKIITDKLAEILEKSVEFSQNEQIFLWIIITAEKDLESLDVILDAFNKNLNTHWEALSGFFHFLLKHRLSLKSEHVRALLQFPVRNFRMAIMNVLDAVNMEVIEEAICHILAKSQFQGQINLLKHLKLWVESDTKLVDILRGKNLQSILSSTLHILSSDYFKEFSKLLDIRQRVDR
jgi:hypothetical protein